MSGLQFKLKNNKIFSKKSASTEPKYVNSVQNGIQLMETMPSTSDEPSAVQTETNTNILRVKRWKKTLKSMEQVKKNKQVIWKKLLSGSNWKFFLSKKNSCGLSTDMERAPTVAYIKQQSGNQSEYVGFLNPVTYWALYHPPSITKTLLNIRKTFTT